VIASGTKERKLPEHTIHLLSMPLLLLLLLLQVPDNGKVGVIGSGKGLTEYKKQKRHEFSVDD
jgi:hypothetical protein